MTYPKMMKILTILAATLLLSGTAWAGERAPQYQSSEPADGAELHQPPDEVTVTFSEPLDSSSQLLISNECGEAIDDGTTEVFGTEMSIGIAEQPSGRYLVDYEAVGLAGLTGTTRGQFSFVVHAGRSCEGSGDGHQGHGGGGNGDHNGHGDGGQGGDHEGHGGHDGDHGNNGATGGAHAEHSPAAGHEGGHSPADGGDHSKHARQEGRSGRSGQPGRARDEADTNVFAGPAGDIVSRENASVEAVVIALLLAAGMGSLGGVMLRIATRR